MEAGNALVFETAPLEEAVEILGFPEFEVTLASDKPVALISATLSLVEEDGAAARVSYGILNLTHRHDDLDLAPMTPGLGIEWDWDAIRARSIAEFEREIRKGA